MLGPPAKPQVPHQFPHQDLAREITVRGNAIHLVSGE